jgi:predicted AlkP superfamily phosphohydrolase/phosphomutase
MKPQRPLLALWLDSADDVLITRWLEEGRLPALQRLFKEGVRARLTGLEHSRAEVVQSVAITGAHPSRSGYWGIHSYDPATYRSTNRGLHNYDRVPPFFALGPERRVAMIDFPQYSYHPGVHGWVVRNWGCHSGMTPHDSRPEGLLAEIDREFGVPDMRHHDHAVLQNAEDIRQMTGEMERGIEIRSRMIPALIRRQPWDLFLTAFTEMHRGGHYLVPNEETLDALGRGDPWAPLRSVYEFVDRAVGQIMDTLPPDWNLAVYSYEGVEPYSDEVQCTFLLADLLLKDSLGRGAFVYEDPSRGPSPEAAAGEFNWVMESWHLRRRISGPHAWLHQHLGARLCAALEVGLGLPLHPERPSPEMHCSYQPLMWLEKYRPYQRAFCLPTFSDAFIRINVRGRESRGVVEPAAFRGELERLESLLRALRHPEKGTPAVCKIFRIRDDPFQLGSELPDADLIVRWHPLGKGGSIECPKLGRFGPAPALRASIHSGTGFFGAWGPDVEPAEELLEGHVLDIAPTLLALAGQKPPAPLEGRVLPVLRQEARSPSLV